MAKKGTPEYASPYTGAASTSFERGKLRPLRGPTRCTQRTPTLTAARLLADQSKQDPQAIRTCPTSSPATTTCKSTPPPPATSARRRGRLRGPARRPNRLRDRGLGQRRHLQRRHPARPTGASPHRVFRPHLQPRLRFALRRAEDLRHSTATLVRQNLHSGRSTSALRVIRPIPGVVDRDSPGCTTPPASLPHVGRVPSPNGPFAGPSPIPAAMAGNSPGCKSPLPVAERVAGKPSCKPSGRKPYFRYSSQG